MGSNSQFTISFTVSLHTIMHASKHTNTILIFRHSPLCFPFPFFLLPALLDLDLLFRPLGGILALRTASLMRGRKFLYTMLHFSFQNNKLHICFVYTHCYFHWATLRVNISIHTQWQSSVSQECLKNHYQCTRHHLVEDKRIDLPFLLCLWEAYLNGL